MTVHLKHLHQSPTCEHGSIFNRPWHGAPIYQIETLHLCSPIHGLHDVTSTRPCGGFQQCRNVKNKCFSFLIEFKTAIAGGGEEENNRSSCKLRTDKVLDVLATSSGVLADFTNILRDNFTIYARIRLIWGLKMNHGTRLAVAMGNINFNPRISLILTRLVKSVLSQFCDFK